jgi:hypothetical protein
MGVGIAVDEEPKSITMRPLTHPLYTAQPTCSTSEAAKQYDATQRNDRATEVSEGLSKRTMDRIHDAPALPFHLIQFPRNRNVTCSLLERSD